MALRLHLRRRMRHLLRLSIATLFALGVSAASASAATTVVQLIELSKAGLTDDILIALIQTDGSVFQLTAADVLALHRAGLSDKVILAMAETARRRTPVTLNEADAPASPQPAQPYAVQPAPPPAPQPPPTVVNNITQNVTQRVEAPRESPSMPYYSYPITVPVYPSIVRPAVAPVYWGFGGQRRLDSWDDGNSNRPDDKKKDH